MTMTHNNVDELATMELLESQTDVNIKMAATCKIRANVYSTAAACIRHGFADELAHEVV